jgi:alkylhydroperoxidase family enzyme
VEAVLEDWRAAPVGDGLRATLGFLEKLTLVPAEVGGEDVAAVRAAGVSDEAIVHAIHVCALFDTINRIADGLGVEILAPETFRRGAALVLEVGY